jgi:hypothetical protein
MSADLSLIDWLEERRQNALQIAKTKRGEDRQGWLEDASYFARSREDSRDLQRHTHRGRRRHLHPPTDIGHVLRRVVFRWRRINTENHAFQGHPFRSVDPKLPFQVRPSVCNRVDSPDVVTVSRASWMARMGRMAQVARIVPERWDFIGDAESLLPCDALSEFGAL